MSERTYHVQSSSRNQRAPRRSQDEPCRQGAAQADPRGPADREDRETDPGADQVPTRSQGPQDDRGAVPSASGSSQVVSDC